jgi:zona occludens toxin (predicted ATPase)
MIIPLLRRKFVFLCSYVVVPVNRAWAKLAMIVISTGLYVPDTRLVKPWESYKNANSNLFERNGHRLQQQVFHTTTSNSTTTAISATTEKKRSIFTDNNSRFVLATLVMTWCFLCWFRYRAIKLDDLEESTAAETQLHEQRLMATSCAQHALVALIFTLW